MKTLCFHEFKAGRGQTVLVDIDTARDGISLKPGLNLIVAPNGFGKSTLLQSIAGVIKPLGGGLTLDSSGDGQSRSFDPAQDSLMISEYLTFPKFILPDEWIEFASGRLPQEARLAPHWKGFRLEELRQKYLGRMSQGERRKVTWLAAHAAEKPLILLDEPLDGLDLLAIEAARSMIRDWKAEGRIVCMIAHQISEVFDLSTQTLVFSQGRLATWEKLTGKTSKDISSDEFRRWTYDYYSQAASSSKS
jgi:ABC-type multidrug transport system ATPase subunit